MAILVVCAVMAAQFLLALVMAWVLGYAGIFLLGFGGARWTSSIAINFYKHVVAIGVALLALSIIGTVAAGFLDELEFDENARSTTHFPYLGLMLAASIIMMVLSTKLPQLLYTLVTGSTLGMYAGSASAAGTAIASAEAAAMATATGRFPGGGGHGGGFPAAHSTSSRTDSVMDAVQRSASAAGGMSDPFHVGAGSDPFGVARSADPYRQARGEACSPVRKRCRYRYRRCPVSAMHTPRHLPLIHLRKARLPPPIREPSTGVCRRPRGSMHPWKKPTRR